MEELKKLMIESIENVLMTVDTQMMQNFIIIGKKPDFTENTMVSATNIFASVVFDKMIEIQDDENMDDEDRIKMTQKFVQDLDKLLFTYCGIKREEKQKIN